MQCLQTLTKTFKGEGSWLLLSANVAFTPEAGKFTNPSPLTSGEMRCLIRSSHHHSQFSGFSWFPCSWQLLLFQGENDCRVVCWILRGRGQPGKLDKKVGKELTPTTLVKADHCSWLSQDREEKAQADLTKLWSSLLSSAWKTLGLVGCGVE